MRAILFSAVVAAQLSAEPTAVALPDQDSTCKGEGEGEYRAIDLRRADATLVVLGTRHRTDPSDPMFVEIERRLSELSPTVVLVEGQPGKEKPTTRDLAIKHGGEGGFACWLAAARGVPCRYADLTETEEAKRLQRRYPADEVLLYFVVRGLAYFNPRPIDQRPPGDLVDWMLRRDAPLVGLPHATQADLARTWERALHRPFEPAAVTTDWHDPFKDEMVMQRISREDNALREPFMIEQLIDATKPGARVLALFGEGHVCNLRQPLREAWQKARTTQR